MSSAKCLKCKSLNLLDHSCLIDKLNRTIASQILFCVEPQHDKVNDNLYGWSHSISKNTKLGVRIAFPHVDSCLGIICELPGDKIFAAHLNGWHEEKKDLNYTEVLNDFLILLNKENSQVLNSAIFGDLHTWFDDKKNPTRAEFPNWRNLNHLKSETGKLDVLFDVDSGILAIMDYIKDRDFAHPVQEARRVIQLYNLNEINKNL